MPSQEAEQLGAPELARVCAIYDDNSRLDHLTVSEGMTSYRSALVGDIDLALAIDQNFVRLVLQEFADRDLNFYELAFNDADMFDMSIEMVRERLNEMRTQMASVAAPRADSAIGMMV